MLIRNKTEPGHHNSSGKSLKVFDNKKEQQQYEQSLQELESMKDNILDTSGKQKLFVQVAAVCNMNVTHTHDVMKHFFEDEEELNMSQVCFLMKRYKKYIIKITGPINVYITGKHSQLSVLNRIGIVANGIKACEKAMHSASNIVEKRIAQTQIIRKEHETDAEFEQRENKALDATVRRLNTVTNTLSKLSYNFEVLNDQYAKLNKEIEEKQVDSIFKPLLSGETSESKFVTAKKMSQVLQLNGHDAQTADRIASQVVYGIQSMSDSGNGVSHAG